MLGTSLWCALFAAILLIFAFSANGIAPFFGMWLSGLTGMAYYVGLAALLLIVAGLMYRLDVRGWWILVVATILFLASRVLTDLRADPLELYRLMHFTQDQIDAISQSGEARNIPIWIDVVPLIPALAYLFFIRRYFRRNAA